MTTKQFIKILLEINKGNKEGLSLIYNEYYNKMVTTANFILKNSVDAEDAASNAIVEIFKYAIKNDKPYIENADAYVFVSAKNAAIKLYNQRKVCVYFDALQEVAATKDEIIEVENKILIEQLMNELCEQDRDIAEMFYFYDVKITIISKELNTPEGTIKWKLREIRKKFSNKLKK